MDKSVDIWKPNQNIPERFYVQGASQIGIAILRGGPTFDHVDDEHIVPEPGNSDWHMFGQSVCWEMLWTCLFFPEECLLYVIFMVVDTT